MNTEKTDIENSRLNLFLAQHKYKYLLLILLVYPFVWGYTQAFLGVHYNSLIIQAIIFISSASLLAFLTKLAMPHFRFKLFVYGILFYTNMFFSFFLSYLFYDIIPHSSGHIVQVDSLTRIWENKGQGVVFTIDTTLQYNKKDETLFIYKFKSNTDYYYVFPVITKNKSLAGSIWVGIQSKLLLHSPENMFENKSFREVSYLSESHFLEAIALSKYKDKKKEVMILTPALSEKELENNWNFVWYTFLIYCVCVGSLLGINFVINLFTNTKPAK